MLRLRHGDRPGHLEALQDAALVVPGFAAAALAQFHQLLLQGLEAVDAGADVLDMVVDQVVDAFAAVFGAVAQTQQAADLFEGHVEDAAVADERQAFDVGLGVDPVVAVAAGGLGQQAFAFVVTDGLHGAVGGLGQFADLHGISLEVQKVS